MTKNEMEITTPSDRELAMTRTFDAPRSRVFDALIKPRLVKRWLLGPSGWSMPVCEIDLKVGGAYRYVWRSETDGTEMGLSGVFREIVPSERLVVTETFDEAWYPGEALVTNTLVEQDGKTTLTLTIRYESQEARNAVIASGMNQGVAVSYDRLAKLLESNRSESSEE